MYCHETTGKMYHIKAVNVSSEQREREREREVHFSILYILCCTYTYSPSKFVQAEHRRTNTNIRALSGTRTHDLSIQAAKPLVPDRGVELLLACRTSPATTTVASWNDGLCHGRPTCYGKCNPGVLTVMKP
jgi:hypothetical protein